MSIVPKNTRDGKVRSNRRKRKKRRTEDFSSSSESSSDSASSDDDNDDAKVEDVDIAVVELDKDVVLSDDEKVAASTDKDQFEIDLRPKLRSITLTKSELSDSTNNKNINVGQLSNTLKKSRKDLENSYMNLMFENYGDDINDLRKAPDFHQRSLTILANVLRNGSNIFDESTLKAVTNQ